MNQIIHTPRLLLRGFRMSDATDFFTYAKDSQVGPAAGWAPHQSIQETRRVIRHFMGRRTEWAIVERATGTVIGSFSARLDGVRVADGSVFEIGYAMGRPWWGKGYMTEVCHAMIEYLFAEEDAVMVTVRRSPQNNRSARVIEKCGFHLEGTLRFSSRAWDGSIQDSVFYSLMPEEFAQHKLKCEEEIRQR